MNRGGEWTGTHEKKDYTSLYIMEYSDLIKCIVKKVLFAVIGMVFEVPPDA
jgi:hypothetical protein